MDVHIHRCLKCGHYWPTPNTTPPKKCPTCKSPNWDKVHKIVAE